MLHLADEHRVPQVQVRRRGIEADLDDERAPEGEPRTQVVEADDVDTSLGQTGDADCSMVISGLRSNASSLVVLPRLQSSRISRLYYTDSVIDISRSDSRLKGALASRRRRRRHAGARLRMGAACAWRHARGPAHVRAAAGARGSADWLSDRPASQRHGAGRPGLGGGRAAQRRAARTSSCWAATTCRSATAPTWRRSPSGSARLAAPHGVFGIIGNHDDERVMPAELRRRGIEMLMDDRTRLVIRGERLDLAGVKFWTKTAGRDPPVLRGATAPVVAARARSPAHRRGGGARRWPACWPAIRMEARSCCRWWAPWRRGSFPSRQGG